MTSNNSIRMLDMNIADDREALVQEARLYFLDSINRVSEEQRVVDNTDIHLWVSRFIHNKLMTGRLHDELLAANIVQLTDALWREALEIVENYEQGVIDERVQ